MAHPKFEAQKWKPGQSGNPKGRPKRESFEAIVARILDEKMPGADMPKREALARVFVNMLLKQDGKMISEYLAREWPKVTHIDLREAEDPQSPEFVPEPEDEAQLEKAAQSGEMVH